MPGPLRIACCQCREICGDTDQAIAAIVERTAWAEENSADLCLFPESFLQGYPQSRRTVEGSALRISDAPIQALLTRLSGFRPTAVVGFIEASEGAFYNSVLVIRAGRCLGIARKRHPNEDGISPGLDAPVFPIGDSRFGISICNDANYPEALTVLAQKGARVILAPLNNMLPHATADAWRHKTLTVLQDRARETGCWLASADVVGATESRRSYGCTALVSPAGDIKAKAPENIPGAILQTLEI